MKYKHIVNIQSIKVAFCFMLIAALNAVNGQAFIDRSSGSYGGTFNINLSEYDGVTGIDGNPYLSSDWQAAVVYRSNGDSILLEEVKYNGHEQNLVFRFRNKEYVFPSEDIISFRINNMEFVKKSLDGVETSFVRKLFEGESNGLYELTEIAIREGKESIGYLAAEPPKYVRKDMLVLINKEVVHKVLIKKNKIKLSPENQSLSQSLNSAHKATSFEDIENFILALERMD